VTGQLDRLQMKSSGEKASQQQPMLKCGMPAVTEFILNRDKIDNNLLKVLGAQVVARPSNLPLTKISPSGKFLIHYSTTGTDAVFNNSSIVPGGSQGYIDSVAIILDNVYDYLINQLGYPAPPSDGFYPSGGDDKIDIYLTNLGGSAFGLTYLDSLSIDNNNPITATSFIELDNDFQEVFSYKDRPLDAVRVTLAHELFHVVQFGIDFTETQNLYWLEMSSTWMEEEIYDNINDYYSYLPFFFDSPWASIQRFENARDFHPYASMLYPLYLSERLNRDVIREIWLLSGSLGSGPHFLEAAQDVIDSVSNGTISFATSFSEFALWNYFTGSRANLAPPGIGYSERLFYNDEFSDNPNTGTIAVHATYPISVMGNQNPFNPDHNAAFYLKFEDLNTIKYDTSLWNCYSYTDKEDTTYWKCNNGFFPSCIDSSEVFDTLLGYDTLYIDTITVCVDSQEVFAIYDSTYWNCIDGSFPFCFDSVEVTDTSLGYDTLYIDTADMVYIDSVFTINLVLDIDFNQYWGLSIIYHQFINNADSIIVDMMSLPPGEAFGIGLDFYNSRIYRSFTLVFTPSSSFETLYKPGFPNGDYYVAYRVNENGALNIDCPADTIDVFLTEPGYFCQYLDISPATASVITSYGDFVDDTLCLYVDTSGFYDISIFATDDTLTDTCNVVFKAVIGELAMMAPYPNPVIVSELAEPKVSLKIKLPIGFINNPILNNPYLVVDIFNIAGEYIHTLDNTTNTLFNNPGEGEYWTEWDLKNSSGRNVASGVYIAFARFYSAKDKGELLTEVKTKIAVIR
ncbi:MAG: MXAN_6640 family putative metalloprotease, partial [Candidatus Zixiibacteriota bacterium]